MADDIRSDIIINVDTSVGIAEIKNLQRQISQLNAQLLQSGARQARAAQDIQANLIKNINATGKFAANVRTISTTAESFTTALERNKLSMGEYFKYAGASTKTFGRLFKSEFDTIEKVARERVKTLQTQYIKLGRDANGAMKAIAVRPLALDMENLATKTALAAQKQQLFNQLLKQGSTNLLNFGKNTQWAGRQLMVGFTIPLGIMATRAGKEFEKIEKQAIRFKRVYGDAFDTEQSTNEALDNMKRLADEFTKYGIEVNKTLELAADAAQMGLKGAELRAQVTEATRLAVLGEVEQQEALETTISVTNAFGIAAENLASKINFLNAVENETITAIQDLTIAIPKAGPVVKQLGGDVEDLAFFLTAMKEGGINASEGANALKSGLASLINPSGKASEMLAGLGINIKGIVEANKGDVKGIVIDFAKALDTLDPLNRARAIEQLFGKFQFSRLSTLFQNVIKEGSQASKVLKLAQASTEELAIISERELKRVEESPLFKFQKQLEKFQAALAPLGEEFMKAVTPILEFGTELLKKFNNMGDGAKQFAVIATTVVAGIGPIFLMMFGLIANGAANLIKLFANLMKVFTGVGKGSQGLGLSTEYMTQQQLEAAAVAASLDQSHAKLIQTFTSETLAVNNLASAYARAVVQQSRLLGINPETGAPIVSPAKRVRPRKLAKGIMSVPGPKGAGDIVPAMLSPGEAIIPAKQSQKYAGLIQGMIDDNIPGYRFGRNPFANFMQKVKPQGTRYGLLEGFLRLMTGNRTGAFNANQDFYTDAVAKKFLRSRPNVAVRMPMDKFSELAQSQDKRYKSVFETGFSKAGDTPAKRAIAEQRLFGLPENIDPSKRPVYGYLFKQERGVTKRSVQNKDGSWKPSALSDRIFERLTGTKIGVSPTRRSSVKTRMADTTGSLMNPKTYMYGNLAMILKRRGIKNRTTFTYGDSYKAWGDRYATPAPLGTFSAKKIKAAYTSRDKDFFEAQILGGFSLKDVKRIVTTEPALIPQIQNILRANGLNIPVGMPRFSMMQRLQKLVYGKKMYEDRLPFTAKYGPKAGKYTNPPITLGNRKVWLNEGIASVPAPSGRQSGRSFVFDDRSVLEAAHMSGGTSVLTKRQLKRLFERQLDSADREGLLAKFGMNRDAISKEFNQYLNSKGVKGKKQFSLFSNITEPVLKELNQKFSKSTNLVSTKVIKDSLDRLPKGLLGSGIRSRLPEGHGIPNATLNQYAEDLSKDLRARVARLGNKSIKEKELQRLYREAQTFATSNIQNAKHRGYISDLNTLSRYLLTPATLNPGTSSGKNRKYLESVFGNVQKKTSEQARKSFPQFLSKNSIKMPPELVEIAKTHRATLNDQQRMQFERALIEASNQPDSKKKSAFEKVIADSQAGKPVAPKPRTAKPKAVPKNIFSMSRILKAGGGLGRVAALGGIFGLMFGGGDVLKAANGVFSVPGPKGAGDIVPAMLSPGESVIPARQSQKYAPLVQAMISDSVPGYEDGLVGATGGSKDGGLKRIKTLGESIGKSLGKTKELVKGVSNGLAIGAKDAMAKAVIGKIGIPGALTTLPSGKILDNDTGKTYANQAEFDKEQARIRAAKVAGTSYQTPGGMIKTFNAAGKATVVSRENAKARAERVEEARAAKAAEQDARRQKFAQGARGFGMVGMGVSMAAGAAAMLPGEAGKIAGDIAPLMLGLGTLAMFIQGPVSAALVALVAAIGIPAYAAFKAAEAFDNAQKKALALAESLGTGDKAIQKFADFAGNVTASELMDRRRSEKFGTFQIRSGKTTFGQAFMQSEAGQGMLGDVTGAIKSGGRGAAVSQLTAQMSTAVASGAMSAAQARSVVANLAEEMGDYSFGIQVNAELIRLLGPNGEDLTKDPLAVRLEILANQQEQLKSTMDLAKKATEGFDWNAVGGAAAGAVAGGLAGAGIGAAIGTAIAGPVGTAVGAVAGGLIGLVSGGITGFIMGGEEKRTKVANASGAAVAMQQMALEQQQQMTDSLELEYQKRIAAADAAGDLVEKERLLKELQDGRVKLLEQNQKLNQQIMDSYADTKDTELRDALAKGADKAVTARYAEGPMAEVAKLGLDRLKESELTAEQQYLVKVQMASGELSPLQVVEMLSMETATQTKVLNIVTKYGGAFAGQVTALTGMFVDKDGKPIQSVVTNFVAKIDAAKTPEDAQKILDFYGKVSQSGAVLDTAVTVDFLLKNPQKAAELQKKFDDIANIKGPLTVEVLTKVLGKDEIAAINEDLAYFSGLNDEEKKIYTQVLATTISTVSPNDPALQNWLKSEGAKWENSPPGVQIREYAQWNAQVVTETSMDTTKAPSETGGGGGGGTKQDPYEEPLRRLKEIREAAVNASGGLKEMNKWLGGNKNMKQFRGLEQQLIKRGASRSFIDYLLGLDKDIQAKFIKVKNGILTLTAAGKTMGKVFNEIALGEFQVGLQESARDATNQSIAFTKLTNAGMSASQALAAVEDKAVAAAIASKSISAEELKNLANEATIAERIVGKVANRLQIAADILNEFGNLSMQDRFARNDTTFTEQEQLAIQMDATLSKAYSDFISKGIPIPGNFGERLQQIMDSIQFKEKIFEDGFSKAMEKFAAQEEKLRIDMEFELKEFKIDGVAGKGAREILAAAQNEIAGLQFKLDDLNAGIQEIEWQEDAVNEKYDKRLEALDKIEKVNQTLAAQQKTQLTLADALSQGDIAAAARAAQEMRSQSAQDALTGQRDILDASRQTELDNLRATNGKTRKELEASILDIEKQIFAIEEQRLEPAAEQIRKAEAKLAVDINSLTVAGKTKLEWEQIKNGIDIARTSSQLYTDAINAALDVVKAIKDYWDNLDNRTITTYHKIITIREDGSGGESDGSSGGSNNGSNNESSSDTKKDDQNSDETVSDAEKSLKAFKDSGMTVSGYVKKIDSAAEAAAKAAKAAKIKEDQAKSSKEFKDSNMNVSGYSKKLDLVPKNPGMSVPPAGFVKPNIKTGMDTINDAINWLGDVTGFKKTVDQVLGIRLASGGMVKRYAAGGFAMGTDIVPAMLTPGEFVVSKYGVNSFGADRLKAINNGSYEGSSLYNYEVNVNVHSNADPNQIAGAVMTKIRQIDAQRIRGNRF